MTTGVILSGTKYIYHWIDSPSWNALFIDGHAANRRSQAAYEHVVSAGGMSHQYDPWEQFFILLETAPD